MKYQDILWKPHMHSSQRIENVARAEFILVLQFSPSLFETHNDYTIIVFTITLKYIYRHRQLHVFL